MSEKPSTLKLSDYKKPNYLIPKINLEFLINSEESTAVKSVMEVVSNGVGGLPFELRGEKQKLNLVKLDGKELCSSEYELTEKTLVIPKVPGKFILEVESEINPAANSELLGLYKSGEILCTQCEAEGFRNIIFHPDRPDVMSRYTTRIEADKSIFPTLLSNGNLLAQGNLPNGRHYVVWDDPFPKPSYLFALVAGNLGEVRGNFTTMSGRKINLGFYVDKGDEQKAVHALLCLKKAMKWDEDTFGLECDLDRYMVVAVSSFNAGAMENKGLNIFNSKYVLANSETATDSDFEDILTVIGHEYFHNWTGNRVTLRDWFQLTLKEGLTVYRDRRFTSDLTSETLKRLYDVRRLKNLQFPEDSGPNAHPIRPQEVINIENFYTPTVYQKGAEVIRMIEVLIGKEAFRKGIDKYFELYDGQAVTSEDFLHAMEIASGKDLAQFSRWYSQAGTPLCDVETHFDESKGIYTINVKQSNLSKDGKSQEPLHFPLAMGLLGKDGKDILAETFEVKEASQSFVLAGIKEKPVPSLLRSFSAPVKLRYDYSDEELAFLMANDSDLFNRCEAGQRLATKELHKYVASLQKGKQPSISQNLLDAYGKLLENFDKDKAFTAEALILPQVPMLVEDMQVCDYVSAVNARKILRKEIATAHEAKLSTIYGILADSMPYSNDSASIAKRSLKNIALSYLLYSGKSDYIETAFSQFSTCDNMTDSWSAFGLLCGMNNGHREEIIQQFRNRWKSNSLVMDKWFSAQSGADLPDILYRVRQLENDPAYDSKNPNKIRAVISGYVNNHLHFHDASGEGYAYVADKILEIDSFNPHLAAGMSKVFKKYAKLDDMRKENMKCQLQRILDTKPSDKVYEIISNTLNEGQ